VPLTFVPFGSDISHKPENQYCPHITEEPKESPFNFFRLGSSVETNGAKRIYDGKQRETEKYGMILMPLPGIHGDGNTSTPA
jgi:hypothetical protein